MRVAKDDRKVLATGATGSVIAAICCFTPALAILLGAAGLSAWLLWIDYALLPALVMFLGVTGYGVYLRQQNRARAHRPAEKRRSEQEAMEKSS